VCVDGQSECGAVIAGFVEDDERLASESVTYTVAIFNLGAVSLPDASVWIGLDDALSFEADDRCVESDDSDYRLRCRVDLDAQSGFELRTLPIARGASRSMQQSMNVRVVHDDSPYFDDWVIEPSATSNAAASGPFGTTDDPDRLFVLLLCATALMLMLLIVRSSRGTVDGG
jgi:hypothetical protein